MMLYLVGECVCVSFRLSITTCSPPHIRPHMKHLFGSMYQPCCFQPYWIGHILSVTRIPHTSQHADCFPNRNVLCVSHCFKREACMFGILWLDRKRIPEEEMAHEGGPVSR